MKFSVLVSCFLIISLVRADEQSPEDQKLACKLTNKCPWWIFKLILYFKDNKYFKEKRVQQQAAVKHLLELKDGKKQFEMLKPVITKLFDVLYTAIEKLAKVQTNNRDLDDLKADQQIANGIYLNRSFITNFLKI